MAAVAKRYQDQLKRIKQNIEKAYEYFKPNYDRYNKFRKFVFQTSLSDDDKSLLKELKKPQIEFNICEAFISRLRGEFSKQEPSISVRGADGAQVNGAVIDIVEGHIRSILYEANNDGFEYNTYTNSLSGGFSVMKCWTEYCNDMSFDQVIRVGNVFDATLCGFDPLAKLPHKGDGQFCFEVFPKTIDEAKQEIPNLDISQFKFSRSLEGFNWSYQGEKDEILLICDYYEKKCKKAKIVQLSNGQVLMADEYKQMEQKWADAGIIEQIPSIVKTRTTDIITICRYRLVENEVLEYEETDYKYLPLVFVDGNSIDIRNGTNGSITQLTRPYIYHAEGIQKLKNFAGQTLANELENMVMHKFKVAKEAIPNEFQDAYTNVQQANVLVYNAYDDNDPSKALPPPQEIVRTPTPPEVTNTFRLTDEVTQTILGSYDASLGINNNQLSGIAIVEGATQSNSAAMPYVVGFLQALNQLAQIIVDLIPKYYVTPRTIPIVKPDGKKSYALINHPNGTRLDYCSNALEVRVEAGVNFAIQKSRALQQIIAMMQASPQFNQFMNDKGLPILLDNIEIRGIDQLKQLAEQYIQEMQQQKAMMMQQAQQQAQQNPLMQRNQIEMAKLQQKSQKDMIDAKIEQQEQEIRKLEAMVDLLIEQSKAAVQNKKAEAEIFSHAVDDHLKVHDQAHRHTKDKLEFAHKLRQGVSPDGTEANIG